MNAESVKDEDVFPVGPCEEMKCVPGRSMMIRMRRSNAKKMKEKLSDPILCEIPEHLHQERKKNTTSRTCHSDRGVQHVCTERQETNIINDEIKARRACQRWCSTIASLAPRERKRLSRFKWRTTVGPA